MTPKYSIGQKVRVELGSDPNAHPRYSSLQSYHGRRGTVVARREGEEGADNQACIYEVRLRMHGNVVLTLGEDALVAIRR